MRNQPKPLDLADSIRQDGMHRRLKSESGRVKVDYIKRDGSKSSSTGTVGDFSGIPGMDTGSITILTEDKGPRTINLHRIKAVHRA